MRGGTGPPDTSFYPAKYSAWIKVSESCLLSNSQHFTRVLEDISVNTQSEYLMHEDAEDAEEDEDDCEEYEEDDTFSSVSYESVSTVMDFLAKKISDLELSEDSVSQVQHVKHDDDERMMMIMMKMIIVIMMMIMMMIMVMVMMMMVVMVFFLVT